MQKGLNKLEAFQKSVTNFLILLFSFGMLFLMVGLYQTGNADLGELLIATIAMMGSFGPVVALANLSNNLKSDSWQAASVFCPFWRKHRRWRKRKDLKKRNFGRRGGTCKLFL